MVPIVTYPVTFIFDVTAMVTMAKVKVTIYAPRDLHERVKEVVEQGLLDDVVRSVSDFYVLGARCLLRLLEEERAPLISPRASSR